MRARAVATFRSPLLLFVFLSLALPLPSFGRRISAASIRTPLHTTTNTQNTTLSIATVCLSLRCSTTEPAADWRRSAPIGGQNSAQLSMSRLPVRSSSKETQRPCGCAPTPEAEAAAEAARAKRIYSWISSSSREKQGPNGSQLSNERPI